MKKNEILKIYSTNYLTATKALLKAAELATLIRQKSPDKVQPAIAIKPNLVSPTPAEFGATTHSEVVAGIIEYLRENGFQSIKICEGSWVGDKTSDSFEYCGYNALSAKYDIPLVDTQTDSFHQVYLCDKTTPEISSKVNESAFVSSISSTSTDVSMVNICDCMKDVDFLINVPVLKGHCQTKITCALKNLKGLIPNKEKRRFHTLGLHKPIAILNTCIHQDFIVVDHICGDPDFEDGGNPLVTNCIMAARDPVLCDSYAAKLLKYEPSDIEYITIANVEGVGSTDLDSLSVKVLEGEQLQEIYAEERFIEASEGVRSHTALELNYATDAIDSCSACYSSLTTALDRLQKEGRLDSLTNDLGLKFCIGQGYRKKSNTSEFQIGVGNCTHAFQKNIPGCPPSEEDVYTYLSRMLD